MGRGTDEVRRYVEHFESLAGPPKGAEWTEPMRKRALARFSELGFPTPKEEEWRQTNVAAMRKHPFRPAAGVDPFAAGLSEMRGLLFGEEAAAELVFLNGRFAKNLSRVGSLPAGVVVTNLAEATIRHRDVVEDHLGRYADYETASFAALNTAFLSEGAFIRLPENVRLEKPIHVLHLAVAEEEPFMVHPRTLLLAGAGAEGTVIETYAGPDGATYFTNAVTEAAVGENASIGYDRVQREGEGAYHIGTLQVSQGRSSRFRSLNLSFGGRIARTETNALLDGEGIETVLDGLYLGRGEQLIDNHTSIDHARPHGESHELYKGILTDKARGVFRGKITVRQDAQKTDAKQTNQALLLSEEATIHSKPQLEIHADDVKCTHGATVGQLDPEAIFYLRSRGIEEEAARTMLIFAFASDLVGRVDFIPLRDRLEDLLVTRLPQGEKIRGER